ncbi:uncharacterized protein LOC115625414 [Scaptodrosophila lebanonensis]|uniref:Uncharacterized protein LOC115625414 n=1 Tax=Drosophila lebanonensis TaxID=7225 RepID=A0A6J2TMF7_DROLE|nr:uncharacterized protein LOC115625414 [Scaptodrosophila lebanonensis]
MAKTIKVIGCVMAVVTLGLLFLGPQLLQLPRGKPSDIHINVTHELNKLTLPPATNLNSFQQQQEEKEHELLVRLHRHKRYLLFPEGSSFQLVFDLIIPIVDYTNFAIMGITCAVAWELPSKPASELIENVRTRLNDGTLGVVRRNDSVAAPPKDAYYRPPANWHALHAQSNQQTKATPSPPPPPKSPPLPTGHHYTNGWRDAATSAYANANAQRPWQTEAGATDIGMGPANWHARQPNNWWERNKARIEENWRDKQRLWSTYEPSSRNNYYTPGRTGRQRKLLQAPPTHRVYPVFGKRRRRRRSLDTDAAFDRIHLKMHLTSREMLFRKIERLYTAQKLNGTACVLRALCESRERLKGTAQPQSFIMELLSAIFQLPTRANNNTDGTEKYISLHYLETHAQGGDCAQLYSDCSHTFWLD